MRINQYISIKEHRMLIVTAFAIVIFSIFSPASELINDYNKSVIEKQEKLLDEAIGNGTSRHFTLYILKYDNRPCIRLIIFLMSIIIFASLFNTKKFLIPFVFSLFGFLLYFLWHFSFLLFALQYLKQDSFGEKLAMNANLFDYLASIGFTLILFWQISILFRMLMRTNSRNEILP